MKEAQTNHEQKQSTEERKRERIEWREGNGSEGTLNSSNGY